MNQRYEVANYENIFIPTNLEVINDVRDAFGEFYRTLYSEVLDANPNAVVTEYSWNASTCDPCPGPTLDQNDYYLLGADVLFEDEDFGRNFVVTRLHARYDAGNLGEDLVLAEASPVLGGREVRGADEQIEQGVTENANVNNFQGRYIIRHSWEGAVLCVAPNYGNWGGPPNGEGSAAPISAMSPNSEGTSANAEGDDILSDDLNELVLTPIPELGITGNQAPGIFGNGACGCHSNQSNPVVGLLLGCMGLFIFLNRKKTGELMIKRFYAFITIVCLGILAPQSVFAFVVFMSRAGMPVSSIMRLRWFCFAKATVPYFLCKITMKVLPKPSPWSCRYRKFSSRTT